MSKTKISYSSVSTFKECPQKYWNQKTHQMKAQSSAFGFGSAFESGAEHMLKGGTYEEAVKIFETEWHTRPENRWEGAKQLFDSEDVFFYQSDYDKYLIEEDMRQIEDWYSELYGKNPTQEIFTIIDNLFELMDAKKLTKVDTRFIHRVMWLCCNKRGPVMLKAFEREILPEIEEVIGSQIPIDVTNDENDQVTGYIDFIVRIKGIKGKVIMDLKSAGRPYEEHDLDTSDQLGIYAVAENINNIGYWVVLKKMSYNVFCGKCGHKRENSKLKNCASCKDGKYSKREPYTGAQIMIKTLSEDFIEHIKSDYSEVLLAIKNEVVWKNNKSCFNYGTKCEFYDHCWKNVPLDKMTNLKKKGE